MTLAAKIATPPHVLARFYSLSTLVRWLDWLEEDAEPPPTPTPNQIQPTVEPAPVAPIRPPPPRRDPREFSRDPSRTILTDREQAMLKGQNSFDAFLNTI